MVCQYYINLGHVVIKFYNACLNDWRKVRITESKALLSIFSYTKAKVIFHFHNISAQRHQNFKILVPAPKNTITYGG